MTGTENPGAHVRRDVNGRGSIAGEAGGTASNPVGVNSPRQHHKQGKIVGVMKKGSSGEVNDVH